MLNIKEEKALKNKKEAMKYFSNDLESISSLLSQYYPLELLKMSCWEERRVSALQKKDPLLLLSRRLLPFLLQSILQSNLYKRGSTFSVNRDIKQKDWERLLNLSYDAAKRLAWYLENHIALLFKDESLNKHFYSEVRKEVFNQFFATPVKKEDYEISKEMIPLLLENTDKKTKELFDTTPETLIENFISLSDYSYDAIDKLKEESKEFKAMSELLIKLKKDSGDERSNQEILKDVIVEQSWESWVKRLTDERDEFDLYKVEIPTDLSENILEKFSTKTGVIDFEEYFNEGFMPSYTLPFVTFHGRYYSFVTDYLTQTFPFIAANHYANEENSFDLNNHIAGIVSDLLKQMFTENDTIDVYSYQSQKIDAIFLPSLKYVNAFKNSKSFILQASFREEVMNQKAKSGHKLLIIDADNFDTLKKLGEDVYSISAAALNKTCHDSQERKYFYVEIFGDDSVEDESSDQISEIFDEDETLNTVYIEDSHDEDTIDEEISDEIEYDETDEDAEAERLALLDSEEDDLPFENNEDNTTKFDSQEEKEEFLRQYEQIEVEDNQEEIEVMDEIFENDDFDTSNEDESNNDSLFEDVQESFNEEFDFDDLDFSNDSIEESNDYDDLGEDLDPGDEYLTDDDYLHDPYYQVLLKKELSKEDPQLDLFSNTQKEEDEVKSEVEIVNIDDDEIFIEDEEVESLDELEEDQKLEDAPTCESEDDLEEEFNDKNEESDELSQDNDLETQEENELDFEDDEFSDDEDSYQEDDELESIDEILEDEIYNDIEDGEDFSDDEELETEENTETIYDEDFFQNENIEEENDFDNDIFEDELIDEEETEEYSTSDLASLDGASEEEILDAVEDETYEEEADSEEFLDDEDLEEDFLDEYSEEELDADEADAEDYIDDEEELLNEYSEEELEADEADAEEFLDDEDQESIFDIEDQEEIDIDETDEEDIENEEKIFEDDEETLFDIDDEDLEEEYSEEELDSDEADAEDYIDNEEELLNEYSEEELDADEADAEDYIDNEEELLNEYPEEELDADEADAEEFLDDEEQESIFDIEDQEEIDIDETDKEDIENEEKIFEDDEETLFDLDDKYSEEELDADKADAEDYIDNEEKLLNEYSEDELDADEADAEDYIDAEEELLNEYSEEELEADEADAEDFFDDENQEETDINDEDSEEDLLDEYSEEELDADEADAEDILNDEDQEENIEEEKEVDNFILLGEEELAEEDLVDDIADDEALESSNEDIVEDETEDDLFDLPEEEIEEIVEEVVEEKVEEKNNVKLGFMMRDFSNDIKPSQFSIRPEFNNYPTMISQILSRLYPQANGAFYNFVKDVDDTVLTSFVNAVRESWKVQLQDGKDKMFSIADYSLSIILALPKHKDELRDEELLNNAGAVMYSKRAKKWNALIISLGVEGSVIEASERVIDQSSFSQSNWKIVTVIGEQLLSRERSKIR